MTHKQPRHHPRQEAPQVGTQRPLATVVGGRLGVVESCGIASPARSYRRMRVPRLVLTMLSARHMIGRIRSMENAASSGRGTRAMEQEGGSAWSKRLQAVVAAPVRIGAEQIPVVAAEEMQHHCGETRRCAATHSSRIRSPGIALAMNRWPRPARPRMVTASLMLIVIESFSAAPRRSVSPGKIGPAQCNTRVGLLRRRSSWVGRGGEERERFG